jgi:uncharacterized protein YbjT (DUF2867 family)
MARIAIVGGHGKIARLLIPLLAARGHVPVALTRNPAHADTVGPLGATWRHWDIEDSDPADDVEVFRGVDVVVFSAGGGPDGRADRKRTVDLGGSLRSQRAALAVGIARFVQVSAIRVDQPADPSRGPVWAAYVAAKREADEALRASGLDWTILRPGSLSDDPGTGLVHLGTEVPPASVPRADVAAALAAVIDEDRSTGRQWDLVGGNVPVDEAIARLVAGPA